MIIARFELVVHGPFDPDEPFSSVRLAELNADLNEHVREAEENLTILLPQDYYITIERKESE